MAKATPRAASRTPEREYYVHGHRLVTLDDVRRMYADFGELHIFERGDFDRDRAFRMTARWLQQQADIENG